jgi:Na+(H+)/acetate symporter ActP
VLDSTSTSKPLIGALIGVAIAIVLAVIAGILLCVCCRRNKDVFVDVPGMKK